MMGGAVRFHRNKPVVQGWGKVAFSVPFGEDRLGLVMLGEGYWFFGLFKVVGTP